MSNVGGDSASSAEGTDNAESPEETGGSGVPTEKLDEARRAADSLKEEGLLPLPEATPADGPAPAA